MLTFYGDRRENKVALTFDDGPNPYGTPKVLDILDLYGVKASFFVIGKWVRVHPEIVQRMHEGYHSIGLHGWNHLRSREVWKVAQEVEKTVDGEFRYIRPPFGNIFAYLPEVRSPKHYVVLGDVPTFDCGRSSEELCKTVTTDTRNGSIVIFHDGSQNAEEMERCKQTIIALPRIIETLQKEYQLVSLDQMNLQPANPFSLGVEALGYGMRKLRPRTRQHAH